MSIEKPIRTKLTVYTVQIAQYDESNGELIPFAKPFASLEEAAKFIVKDYNSFCKTFEDENTLSKTAWKGLTETKVIESSADWPVWIKWTIAKQSITFPFKDIKVIGK